MKTCIALTFLFLAAALGAAPVSAQNMTGTWEVMYEGGRGGTVTQVLTATQEGSTLTGTIAFQGGGRGGPGGGGRGPGGQTVEISDGTVDGASFSFTVNLEMGGGSVTLHFSGTYEADFMEGNIEGGRGGSRPFMGTRND
ncbi:MAG: hypothetical protein PVJ80_02210 [Gemmatimonadota bacterium]|jgi:hypothetical protein